MILIFLFFLISDSRSQNQVIKNMSAAFFIYVPPEAPHEIRLGTTFPSEEMFEFGIATYLN